MNQDEINRTEDSAPKGWFGSYEPYPAVLDDDRADTHDEETPVVTVRPEFPPFKLGQLCQEIYDMAYFQVPEIALITGLGLAASLGGRTYQTPHPATGTNLYLILAGKSGIGKEHITVASQKLLYAASDTNNNKLIPRFMNNAGFKSGAALATYQSFVPCFGFLISEFGKELEKMTARNAPTYTKELEAVLLKAYPASTHSNRLSMKLGADVDAIQASLDDEPVLAPSLTIIGEGTPSTIFDCMSDHMTASGFLPRFLLIDCADTDIPKPNRNSKVLPVPAVMNHFTSYAEACSVATYNDAFTFTEFTPDALEYYEAAEEATIDERNALRGKQEQYGVLLGRAGLNTKKLATLIAAYENPYKPVVTLEMVKWAEAFVDKSTKAFSSRLEADDIATVRNVEDAKELAVLKAIQDYVQAAAVGDTEQLKKWNWTEQYKGLPAWAFPKTCIAYILKQRAPFSRIDKNRADAINKAIDDMARSEVISRMHRDDIEKHVGKLRRNNTQVFFADTELLARMVEGAY